MSNIFERLREMLGSKTNTDSRQCLSGRARYSVVTSFAMEKSTSEPPPRLLSLIDEWKRGTKIILFFRSSEARDYCLGQFQQYIETLDAASRRRFTLYKPNGEIGTGSFHLETYVMRSAPRSLEIVDGNYSSAGLRFLNKAGQATGFNTGQYLLEHAAAGKDIMVTAGAGTGKTACMISRIGYLIYKHELTADTLPEALIMLTFTNEAASNMKLRLQEYFQSYFHLTMDCEALRLAECIKNMRIGTIHSFAKRILEHYSVKLGLGKSIAVKSGKLERDEFLAQALDRYIADQGLSDSAGDLFNMPLRDLQGCLSEIMDKLQSKNVDIVNDPLYFGEPEDARLHNAVTAVTKAAEAATREYFDKQSAIRLPDLIIRLKELVSVHGEELSAEGFSIRYLFVDEFQDTDDVQIGLMKSFREIFGFRFFVVGDVKQCIYRFRGADERAFDTLAAAKSDWARFSLNKNYRTDKKLLAAYDRRFSAWVSGGLLEYGDSDVLTGVKDLGNSDVEASYYYGDITWRGKTEKEKRFVKVIRRLLEEISDKPGEQIAVLVRDNRQVEAIKRVCGKNGIFVDAGQRGQGREGIAGESSAKVVCSTVHMAKGLEYYAVILPYMSASIGRSGAKGQTDVIVKGHHIGYSIKDSEGRRICNSVYRRLKEEEAHYRRDEEARILYVAMTRAKKRLVYFDDGRNAGSLKEPKSWAALLRGGPD